MCSLSICSSNVDSSQNRHNGGVPIPIDSPPKSNCFMDLQKFLSNNKKAIFVTIFVVFLVIGLGFGIYVSIVFAKIQIISAATFFYILLCYFVLFCIIIYFFIKFDKKSKNI